MATFTGARAASTFPVGGAGQANMLHVAWGTYNIASALSQNDVIEFCKLPAGATVIGGYLQGADIDTGTETFDFDLGWAANGTDAADPDGFGNFGVITGDVSVHTPVAGIYLPLAGVIQSAGPKTFAAETKVQGVCNAAANAGGTGYITAVIYYTMA